MSPVTPRFGIDTSVLVRLLTGEPTEDFDHCVSRLCSLIEDNGAEVFASNQVIGRRTSPFSITMVCPRPTREPVSWTCCGAVWYPH